MASKTETKVVLGDNDTGLAELNTDNHLQVVNMGQLIPEQFDYVSLGGFNANDDPTSVVYKTGGSGGTTIAIITLGYDGSYRLTSVTKTT